MVAAPYFVRPSALGLAGGIAASERIVMAAIGTGGNPGNGGNAGGIGIDGAARSFDACRVRLSNNTSNAFGAGFFSGAVPVGAGLTSTASRKSCLAFLSNFSADFAADFIWPNMPRVLGAT